MNSFAERHALASARWVERWIRPQTRARPTLARSILIFEFALPLGVLVHMTPLFEALKRGLRQPVVTVATRGIGLEVLRHSPFIDHLIDVPDPMQSHSAAATTLRQHLNARALQPDCCLTATSDRRTRIALLAARVCRGWRGGFTLRPSLYHHALKTDPDLSQIANNLRLAELVGCPGGLLEPKVFYSAQDLAHARGLLAPLQADGRPVLVAVTQASGGQRTSWLDERWTRTLLHAQAAHGYQVVYVGTAADLSAIETLRALAGGVGVSLAGKTSVGELAALLAMSDLVLTLDTGTMHVGRAVGVPMIVLGPCWQKPLEWLPSALPWVNVLRGEDCHNILADYHLDDISIASVLQAMAEMATRFPASQTARDARVRASLSQVDHLRP